MRTSLAVLFAACSLLQAQVTVINGTDAVSGSRTTINNNFAYLNSWCVDTGTVNNLSCTMVSLGLVPGQRVNIQVAFTNTGAATMTLNSLANIPIVHSGVNLAAGELPAGFVASLLYDGSRFELLGTVPAIPTNAIVIGNGSGITSTTGASCTIAGDCLFDGIQAVNLASGALTNPYLFSDTSGGVHVGNLVVVPSPPSSGTYCLQASSGTMTWGTCGGGSQPYNRTVTSLTTLTVAASTHLQGTTPVAFCLDSTTHYIACDAQADGAGNVIYTWPGGFTGSIRILGGIGSSGGALSWTTSLSNSEWTTSLTNSQWTTVITN